MLKFRVVAVDLDGTVLRSDGSISARTRAALRAHASVRARSRASPTPTPASSRSPLLAVAQLQTSSNGEDGVAHIFKQLLAASR